MRGEGERGLAGMGSKERGGDGALRHFVLSRNHIIPTSAMCTPSQ